MKNAIKSFTATTKAYGPKGGIPKRGRTPRSKHAKQHVPQPSKGNRLKGLRP